MITEEALLAEAKERVSRAQRYAVMFPHLIRSGDEAFQTLEWQEKHLRKVYNLPKLLTEGDVSNHKRKVYMRELMAKKRAQKRGEIPVE